MVRDWAIGSPSGVSAVTLLDEHVDPAVLDLEAAVDHEQRVAAHLERSLHHRGPEHQVEVRILVRQREEAEAARRRRLLAGDHQPGDADAHAVGEVAHLAERDAAERIELGRA